NQTYEIDMWTKRVGTATGDCRVGVTFYNGAHKLGTFYKGIRNTSYAEQKWSFVAPVGFDRAIMFAVKSSDASTLYVDDLSMRTLPNGLILDITDSGTAKAPVIISTYGKKKPAKISAGD